MPSKKPGTKKSTDAEPSSGEARKSSKQTGWSFPPLAWMLASSQGEGWKFPDRMLLCGAIPELGALSKSLPDCEFVVLEPSDSQARSLRTACSRRRLKNIRIETGSADQEALPELTGGNFDLVLAPGIFHCVDSVERSMENLAACTARQGGGLYLELDSAHHPASRSEEIRALYPGGKDDATSEKLGRVAAGVCGVRPAPSANETGSHSRCWPLLKWLGVAAASGLRPTACTLPPRLLPLSLPYDGVPLFGGLDLVSLCCLLEAMSSPPVLQVVFARALLVEPPWSDPTALAEWRPCVQFWPRDKVPVMEAPFSKFMELGINIPGILDLQQFQITAYLLEFLRLSDGKTPVRQILEAIPHPAKIEEIAQALFFFHHTSILRIFPPK